MTNAVGISTTYEAIAETNSNAAAYSVSFEVLVNAPSANTTANAISVTYEVPTFNLSTAFGIGTYMEVLVSVYNSSTGLGCVTLVTS